MNGFQKKLIFNEGKEIMIKKTHNYNIIIANVSIVVLNW